MAQERKLRVEIHFPESYLTQRDQVPKVLDRLREATAGVDIELARGGWSGRRAASELAPLFVLVVILAEAVAREVGTGFLQAVGTQGVEAIKSALQNPCAGTPVAERQGWG